MARLPNSEWRPLPESGHQGHYTKTQFIVHSIVGSAEGAYGYFLHSTDLESTLIVKKSGKTIQVLDSSERADANGDSNRRAISAETEDNGDPDNDPWTAGQVAELIRIGVWCHDVHGIPARQIPAPTEPGMGWHVMFGAPGPWTKVRGKTCPGRVRIGQFHDVVLPGIVAAVRGGSPTPAEEDYDMIRFVKLDDGKVFAVAGLEARYVGDPKTIPALVAAGLAADFTGKTVTRAALADAVTIVEPS